MLQLRPGATMNKYLNNNNNKKTYWTSQAVQWLRPCAANAEDKGLIPGQGTKIPDAAPQGQKIKSGREATQRIISTSLGSLTHWFSKCGPLRAFQ